MSRKEWDKGIEKYGDNLIKIVNTVEKSYVYLNNVFWKNFDKYGFSYERAFNDFHNKQINPFNAIRQKGFNVSKLVWLYNASHLLYKLDAKNPMSIPYRIYYIGGITDEYFDLTKVEKF